MSQSETIARPYAKAVYQQALAQKKLTEWGEFLRIAKLIVSDRLVENRILAPGFFEELKTWLDEGLMEFRGKGIQTEELNFIALLHENRRLFLVPEIFRHYEAQVNEIDGVCRAKVFTAKQLDAKQQKKIGALLETKLGKKVRLEVIEQPDLLAGVRIEYEGLVFDQSAKGKIQGFSRRLDELRK